MKDLQPTILTIFGITGDLSHRYLLPALAEIAKIEHLASSFRVLGVSRQDVSLQDVFRGEEQILEKHAEIFKMDYASAADYQKLKANLVRLDQDLGGKSQTIFYFAVPPKGVPEIVRSLGDAGLNTANTKLLLEKPFGSDLASANKLIDETAEHYPEEQVYRIDHYLAKDMAQNITVFLGSNTLFRDVWNKQFIESIEIIASEKIGIEGRVGFYESTGALRDLVQSHLLQLAALVLMEPCSDIFDFAEIPKRRLTALEALEPANPRQALRAQYQGYKEEVNNTSTTTETFVALTLKSKAPHWLGVPIRIITGKNLDHKTTEIRIKFNKTSASEANLLVIHVQPKEGIELDLWVKKPGYERKLQKLPLGFDYGAYFDHLPDAYEQVLVDAMHSNHSLFASSGEVLASWQILQPLLDKWAGNDEGLHIYKPGSKIGEVLSAADGAYII